VGVEPSERLAAAGRGRGLEVVTGTLPHAGLAGRKFDLVTVVDVIEHVTDPVALLRHAAAHLDAGGILAVVTPDLGSGTARLVGRRWWHFRAAHVGYFDRGTLARAASAAGLVERRRSRPRWYLP